MSPKSVKKSKPARKARKLAVKKPLVKKVALPAQPKAPIAVLPPLM
ncbi:MAG: hypothetical protein ACM3ZT_12640 [Bacillota bacterium]